MKGSVLLVAASSIVLSGCRAAEEAEAYLDPVTVAPELFVLELENQSLRVLRERVPAGSEVPMHSHRARVSVFLRDAEVELAPRGGAPSRTANVAGTAALGAAVTHGGRALGEVENLSIERKEAGGAPIPVADGDGTKVDPRRHVVELEDDSFRVVRSTYPAGSVSPVHAHGPGLAVALSGLLYSESLGGGEWETRESGPGEIAWTDGETPHAVRNDGDEDVVFLRVELKREPGSAKAN